MIRYPHSGAGARAGLPPSISFTVTGYRGVLMADDLITVTLVDRESTAGPALATISGTNTLSSILSIKVDCTYTGVWGFSLTAVATHQVLLLQGKSFYS